MYKKFTRVIMMILALQIVIMPIEAASSSEPVPSNKPATGPDAGTLKSAVSEFKSLSRKERKERTKEAKKAIKKFKAEKRAGKSAETSQVLLIILAILLPPLAVYLHQGQINNKFWISILLTLLFWIPGVIYALIVILGED